MGEVVERSEIPDPARSDYPDCLFSAALRVQGSGAAVSVPEKIAVLLPAFTGRKLEPSAALKTGDLVRLRVTAEKFVSKDLKSKQRADTLTDFSLPVYFAGGFEKALASEALPVSPPSSPDNRPKANAGAVTKARYPWSDKAAALRKFVMEEDASVIRAALARHGGSFEAWQKELRALTSDLGKQTRHATNNALVKGGHFFEKLRPPEYERIAKLADANEGPFRTLVAMSRMFRARGVDFIAVPYPFKEEVNASVFSTNAPDDGIFEPWRQKFLLKLIEADVEVLDMVPALRAALPEHEDLFYPVHDAHPADAGLIIAARAIAGRLERYDFLKRPGFQPRKYRTQKVGFATDHHEKNEIEREYTATQLIYADGSEVLEEDDDIVTPMVIIGDSFTAVPKPYGAKNASICYQLAPYFGELPDLLASMGGAPQMMKIVLQQGEDFFKGRAVAVFMFSPNALLNPAEDVQWIVVDDPASASR